jgi:hypothetical protein
MGVYVHIHPDLQQDNALVTIARVVLDVSSVTSLVMKVGMFWMLLH